MIIEDSKIIASEGMTLFNGEFYGKIIRLGTNDSPDNWYEITDEEAKKIEDERNKTDELLSNSG